MPTNILLVDEKLKRDGHIFFCWRFMYLKKKGRTEKKNISTKYKIFLLARREFGYIFREKIAPSIYLSCNKKEFRFSFFFICLDVCFQAGLSTLTRCTCVCVQNDTEFKPCKCWSKWAIVISHPGSLFFNFFFVFPLYSAHILLLLPSHFFFWYSR